MVSRISCFGCVCTSLHPAWHNKNARNSLKSERRLKNSLYSERKTPRAEETGAYFTKAELPSFAWEDKVIQSSPIPYPAVPALGPVHPINQPCLTMLMSAKY